MERAIRIIQNYGVLEKACQESVDCHSLFQPSEDLDLGRHKIREV